MCDAVNVALDVFDGREATREAIILLSDGGDNRSQATREDTIGRLTGRDEELTIVELITAERPDGWERFRRDDPDADEIDLAALNRWRTPPGRAPWCRPTTSMR